MCASSQSLYSPSKFMYPLNCKAKMCIPTIITNLNPLMKAWVYGRHRITARKAQRHFIAIAYIRGVPLLLLPCFPKVNTSLQQKNQQNWIISIQMKHERREPTTILCFLPTNAPQFDNVNAMKPPKFKPTSIFCSQSLWDSKMSANQPGITME